VLLAAAALLVVGFGVKAALVPLHTWLPDAYTWAPSGSSALLAGAITKLGLLALLRALAALAGVSPSWGLLLMGAGVLNACLGNLLALRQSQVKRLLACSSLAHLGYILLGVGIAVRAGEVAGAQGGLFHFLTHGLMTALAFLAIGALTYGVRPTPADPRPLLAADLYGTARRYPLAALALSVALLGLGGLPPLAGFMSEWQIFAAGFATRDPLASALVVVAALNVLLSLAYYTPLVATVYRQQPSRAIAQGRPLPTAMHVPLAALALAVVALGVWPALIRGITAPAGAALLAAFGG
jgi:formate hydrogenlyase subunit 3/multisubunit Na+/H+ antiporter MnhD subunit